MKLLTGEPIPTGADTVIPYELTDFTDTAVTVFAPAKPGDNVVRTGEDVRKGQFLAHRGDVIDPGTAGTLASQGIAEPEVYRMPKVGILSTGSELVEAAETPGPGSGKIRNSNRYTFEAVLKALGCETVYLGIAGDSAEEICTLLQKGLAECDAVITTGGVSVGDYDLTPEAMEMPGWSCCSVAWISSQAWLASMASAKENLYLACPVIRHPPLPIFTSLECRRCEK